MTSNDDTNRGSTSQFSSHVDEGSNQGTRGLVDEFGNPLIADRPASVRQMSTRAWKWLVAIVAGIAGLAAGAAVLSNNLSTIRSAVWGKPLTEETSDLAGEYCVRVADGLSRADAIQLRSNINSLATMYQNAFATDIDHETHPHVLASSHRKLGYDPDMVCIDRSLRHKGTWQVAIDIDTGESDHGTALKELARIRSVPNTVISFIEDYDPGYFSEEGLQAAELAKRLREYFETAETMFYRISDFEIMYGKKLLNERLQGAAQTQPSAD